MLRSIVNLLLYHYTLSRLVVVVVGSGECNCRIYWRTGEEDLLLAAMLIGRSAQY